MDSALNPLHKAHLQLIQAPIPFIFSDFSSAFDTLDNTVLADLCKNVGIKDMALPWVACSLYPEFLRVQF